MRIFNAGITFFLTFFFVSCSAKQEIKVIPFEKLSCSFSVKESGNKYEKIILELKNNSSEAGMILAPMPSIERSPGFKIPFFNQQKNKVDNIKFVLLKIVLYADDTVLYSYRYTSLSGKRKESSGSIACRPDETVYLEFSSSDFYRWIWDGPSDRNLYTDLSPGETPVKAVASVIFLNSKDEIIYELKSDPVAMALSLPDLNRR